MKLRVNLDIDALIDVRYGWLINQNKLMADEILFNFQDYCNRDHDDFWLMFPQVTEEQCKSRKQYKLPDLKNGVRTNIFNLIDDAVRSSANFDNSDVELIITLNFKQYQLTEKEVEQFKVLVSARFEHQCVVDVMFRPYGKMTPDFVARNFDLNIYYDMAGWLSMYWDGILKQPIPRAVFYTPLRFPSKEDCERNFYRLMNEAKLDSPAPEVISDALSPYIQVYFEQMSYFSPIAVRSI